MKKTLVTIAALAAAAIAMPAQAQDTASTTHPYVGVQVGHHDVGIPEDAAPPLTLDDSGMIYGVFAGVDFDLGNRLVAGIEGNYNLGRSAIDSEYGAAARLGLRTRTGSIVFVRAGYQWVDFDIENFTGVPNLPAGLPDTADDFLVGGGLDIVMNGEPDESHARLRIAVDTISFDSLRGTAGINFAF